MGRGDCIEYECSVASVDEVSLLDTNRDMYLWSAAVVLDVEVLIICDVCVPSSEERSTLPVQFVYRLRGLDRETLSE